MRNKGESPFLALPTMKLKLLAYLPTNQYQLQKEISGTNIIIPCINRANTGCASLNFIIKSAIADIKL